MSKVAGGSLIGMALLGLMAAGCGSTPPEYEHFGRAQIYHIDGRIEKAELEYNEVNTIHETGEIWFNLGLLAEQRGDLVKAAERFKEAVGKYEPSTIGREKKIAEAYMAIGSIAFRQNQFSDALAQFQLAANTYKSDPRTHYNIGVTLEALGGRDEEALTAYSQAINLDPNFGSAHLAMGFIYESSGNIELARMHHSIARQNGVDDSLLVQRLAWWNEWISEDVTASSLIAQQKNTGQFTVTLPREWRIGSASQAGTTIVKTFENTAGTIIGDSSAVQIVGPFGTIRFDQRGTLSPGEYASAQLLKLIGQKDRLYLPELEMAILDAQAAAANAGNGEGNEGSEGNEGNGGGEMPAMSPWKVAGPIRVISFRNGTTGALVEATYMQDGRAARFVDLYFYLGDQNSYVIVTTRDDKVGQATRMDFMTREWSEADREQVKVRHALDYLARHFEEVMQRRP